MAAEFIVAGRRALPPRSKAWSLELRSEAGSVEVYERDEDFGSARPGGSEVSDTAGWVPVCVVRVRKAWDNAQVVAEVIAQAVEGAVFSDAEWEVIFDARGQHAQPASLQALESALQAAFDNAEPYFERWAREELAAREPDAEADDWSEL